MIPGTPECRGPPLSNTPKVLLSASPGMPSYTDRKFPTLVFNKVRGGLTDDLFQDVVKREHSSGNMLSVTFEVRGRDSDNDQIQLVITIHQFEGDTPVVNLSAMTSKGYFDTGLSDEDFEGEHWKPSKELIKGDDQEVEIAPDPDQAADKIISIFKKYRVSSTIADRVVRRFLAFK